MDNPGPDDPAKNVTDKVRSCACVGMVTQLQRPVESGQASLLQIIALSLIARRQDLVTMFVRLGKSTTTITCAVFLEVGPPTWNRTRTGRLSGDCSTGEL